MLARCMTVLALASTIALAPSGLAQSALTPPRIGFVRDDAGIVRPLFGISGNFWLGEKFAVEALSVASSGSFSILKTPHDVLVYNATGGLVGRPTPAAGSGLFAFAPAGSPVFAWLQDSGELLRWNGPRFEPTPVSATNLNGTVISLAAPDSSTAAFLVQRGTEIWRVEVSVLNDAVVFAANLPGLTAPALLFDDGSVLYAGESALVLRNVLGVERTIPFPGTVAQFTQLGSDWVLINNSQPPAHLALRLSTGAVFELPEVTQ
jgi:hypothetical protein